MWIPGLVVDELDNGLSLRESAPAGTGIPHPSPVERVPPEIPNRCYRQVSAFNSHAPNYGYVAQLLYIWGLVKSQYAESGLCP